ncbi:plasmid mobilization protein [Rhodophyticola sp. CCM32]|uniref:plasmid mobilization protein n=1 Tax=Rhodophyticola sp. CCM32 TaxID=2916397 RepID=UPI001EE5D005|nr:plasmid mobilization relaxosome protein MobC [Rhodophyticola sp. CCM32]
MSYADAADTGPCEGRQASPSNPTGAGTARAKEPLSETFVFRCTAAEKAQLRAKAEAAGLPAATLLREALGLTEARRRKPVPRVDPALVLAVGRIGGNLNQIARWLNHAMKVGRADLDTLTVARRLVVIERQLAALLDDPRARTGRAALLDTGPDRHWPDHRPRDDDRRPHRRGLRPAAHRQGLHHCPRSRNRRTLAVERRDFP